MCFSNVNLKWISIDLNVKYKAIKFLEVTISENLDGPGWVVPFGWTEP